MRRFLEATLPLAIAGLLALAGPAAAQSPEEAAPAAAAAPVPDALASPRATMRSFLEATVAAAQGEKSRLEDALATMDLDHLPRAIREAQGEELAVKLKEIIDRVRFVVYDEIPDGASGSPWVFYHDPDGGGSIVLAPDAAGRWRFTRATVEAIPGLYRAVEGKAIVDEVAEAPRYLSPGMWLRSKVPPSLKKPGFLLEHWQWIGLFLLALLGVIVDRLVSALLARTAIGALERRRLAVERELTAASLRPFGLLAMALAWNVGLPWLGLPSGAAEILQLAINFVATASGVWGAYRLVDVASAALEVKAAGTATTWDDLLVPLGRKAAKVFIAGFGLVFIAESVDVSVASLLAGLGLGGLAFALAAQDTVKNLFGSLTVLLDRTFAVGDWVKIGDVEGTVEELGFRSTRVRTFYDSLVTVPNAVLLSASVDNLGKRRFRRWRTTLSLTYDSPPERIEAFCEGVRELIRRHELTRKDYFQVWLNELGPASLDVLLYMFVEAPDWTAELRTRHLLALDILRLAKELGLDFAFPTQTLHVHAEPVPAREPLARDGAASLGRRVGEQLARASTVAPAVETAAHEAPEVIDRGQ